MYYESIFDAANICLLERESKGQVTTSCFKAVRVKDTICQTSDLTFNP